ncbi:F-box domain [Rhizoctonia solani]|uniref:F-box domain n=1 Tax=Rhizoctonia solani TaxID=456999 RepID=A0A8H7IBG9_9AGAM|nr:F-box domain [Rhizoctonia solani]
MRAVQGPGLDLRVILVSMVVLNQATSRAVDHLLDRDPQVSTPVLNLTSAMTIILFDTPAFPPEIWLQISWYLDLPDIDSIGRTCRILRRLTKDPALQRVRLVFTPERVSRSLFSANRPTVLDLVHWNILRGLGIERKWRAGQYLYSTSQAVFLLRTPRSSARATLYPRVLPDIEASSSHIARALLPAVHSLNASLRRQGLTRAIREGTRRNVGWFEGKGRELGVSGEWERLAVCPSVRKSIKVWEEILAHKA